MAIEESNRGEVGLRVETAKLTIKNGFPIDDQLHEIMKLAGDDTSGNANDFGPWSDPTIPFECGCGEIIYADTPHKHQE